MSPLRIKFIELRFGAFCEPISKQLHDQGYRLDSESLDHFQLDSDAIVRLKVRSLITSAQAHSAERKLINRITDAIDLGITRKT